MQQNVGIEMIAMNIAHKKYGKEENKRRSGNSIYLIQEKLHVVWRYNMGRIIILDPWLVLGRQVMDRQK